MLRPSSGNKTITNIDQAVVISLFEQYGVILFREFHAVPEDLSKITDSFTESYAPDALRRPARFGQRTIHNVDSGSSAIPLHSEASFGAVWPEIIWFYCNIAPPAGQGATTLCDGIGLWKNLLAQPLRYQIKYDMEMKRPKRGPEAWPFATPGVSGFINWPEGLLDLSVLRYAVQQTRLPMPQDLCFANHLLVGAYEPQIEALTMADRTSVPLGYIEEIKGVGAQLTFELQWQSGDLLMLDNRRFMHGRRAFEANATRDIVQIQTDRASFAYGATTRRQVRLSAVTRNLQAQRTDVNCRLHPK